MNYALRDPANIIPSSLSPLHSSNPYSPILTVYLLPSHTISSLLPCTLLFQSPFLSLLYLFSSSLFIVFLLFFSCLYSTVNPVLLFPYEFKLTYYFLFIFFVLYSLLEFPILFSFLLPPCLLVHLNLKGLSHAIDFKNFDKNLQN
jgi:hypothetical protein